MERACMLRKLSVVLVTAGAFALGACSSSSGPTTNLCSNITAPCTAITAGMTEAQIDAAVGAATTGTTIVFDAAAFKFTNPLSTPAVSNLTITGQGANATSLDFGSQTAGTAGIAAINGN